MCKFEAKLLLFHFYMDTSIEKMFNVMNKNVTQDILIV
jgi:hypothetical protein